MSYRYEDCVKFGSVPIIQPMTSSLAAVFLSSRRVAMRTSFSNASLERFASAAGFSWADGGCDFMHSDVRLGEGLWAHRGQVLGKPHQPKTVERLRVMVGAAHALQTVEAHQIGQHEVRGDFQRVALDIRAELADGLETGKHLERGVLHDNDGPVDFAG